MEKTELVRFGLDKPLTFFCNSLHQTKTGYKFTVTDRDHWFDWYNAFLRVNYTFKATTDGAAIAEDTRTAPINGSFSLINKLDVKSAGKPIYNTHL